VRVGTSPTGRILGWCAATLIERGAEGLATEHAQERPPDVARAAERLQRPHARIALIAKRTLDLALALVMIAALAPLIAFVVLLLIADDEGWVEHRVRLGRDGRQLRLSRFRPLPGRAGRALERIGARELPLLLAVVAGRLSFVGPRALPPGTGAGFTGPRRLMAPGLLGPAQRWATDAASASELDDAYVEGWSLRADLKLLASVRQRRPLPIRR
jgi:lipopolysaccharide/colanic/teichoic acid biosynthesis glycosyltransferase